MSCLTSIVCAHTSLCAYSCMNAPESFHMLTTHIYRSRSHTWYPVTQQPNCFSQLSDGLLHQGFSTLSKWRLRIVKKKWHVQKEMWLCILFTSASWHYKSKFNVLSATFLPGDVSWFAWWYSDVTDHWNYYFHFTFLCIWINHMTASGGGPLVEKSYIIPLACIQRHEYVPKVRRFANVKWRPSLNNCRTSKAESES